MIHVPSFYTYAMPSTSHMTNPLYMFLCARFLYTSDYI